MDQQESNKIQLCYSSGLSNAVDDKDKNEINPLNEEITRLIGVLSKMGDPTEAVHIKLDEFARNNPKTSCKKGCGYCCHRPLIATDKEFSLAKMAFESQGLLLDEERFQKQKEATKNGSWDKLNYGDKRCVFLSKGDVCAIYHRRPASCRVYSVLSHPKLCDVRKGGDVRVHVNKESEILLSAYYSLFEAGVYGTKD